MSIDVGDAEWPDAAVPRSAFSIAERGTCVVPRKTEPLIFVFALVGILMMPNNTSAQNGIRGQILIKADGGPMIQPRAIIAADDNQFIVAGHTVTTRSGWATKFDAAGKLIWTYSVAADAHTSGAAYTPQLSGVVAMPDGTTFLCGSMPRPPAEYSPALLVHLDGAGRVLGQQLVIPAQRNAHGIARFDDCIRWGDGIAVVGQISHIVQPGEQGARFPSGVAYWALIVDGVGKIRSETQTRASLLSSAPRVGPLLPLHNSVNDLIFGATDNRRSELIQVDATGEAKVVKALDGPFLLVRPVSPDGQLQVYGMPRSTGQAAAGTVLNLDEQLEETHRATGPHPASFSANIAYRLADKSFAMFGSEMLSDGSYTSRAVRVAADLQSEQRVDLIRDSVADLGSISAAAPLQRPNEFVVATPALAREPGGTSLSGAPSGGTRGAVVDFVRFQSEGTGDVQWR